MLKLSRALGRCAGAAVLSLGLCAAANAQTFPSRPITIYVGTQPGGTYDTISRILAAGWNKKWGQSVIVESRIGAGSILATSLVARAAPDGYSLVFGGAYDAQLFFKDTGFDPVKDITPVSVVGVQYYFLLTSRNLKTKTLAEFISKAKAAPGKLNFGLVPGGQHDIETNDMTGRLGVKLNLVGYKGIAPIYVALLANEIDGAMGTTTPQMKTGEMVGLAVGGPKRNADFPDIPTFRELGFNYDPMANYTFYTRTGTPRDVVNKLYEAAAEVAKSSDFADRVTKTYSIEAAAWTPEESAKFLRNHLEEEKAIAERVGIKPQ
jgi:tripartite-type tricarboxylate transporter receptor subunit TctC